MICLAAFVREHREAVTYDLLTRTGYDLRDIGRGLSWSALDAFVRNTPPDGALMRELRPELAQWATLPKTNALLADIYDMLASINANLCAKGTGKKPKRPKPYPRPGKNKATRHIGTALPIEELKRRIFGNKKEGE
jgi:hypothetical protein